MRGRTISFLNVNYKCLLRFVPNSPFW